MKNQLDTKKLRVQLRQLIKLEARHAGFIGALFILFMYLFLVWRIGGLATAEPTPDMVQAASKLPRVDKDAIKKIEALEQRSPEVKSFFNEARNNPFQE